MAKIDRESPEAAMPIAIVGMGCRLPGGATSPEKLWDLLVRKESARSEVPQDRFNVDAFYHPDGDKNGTINIRAGHFLKGDMAAFDAPFFSISPAEAMSMDPMQRMLLEVVYEAMESAGLPFTSLAGPENNTGCFVGCFTSDYDQLAKRDPELLPKYHSVGTGQAILSNRISFCFDLKGPSVTLDTACSSSLVAIHLACQSLRTGESKAAIVGATHAILSPDVMVGMTNLHFLSPDARCYTFDERANGYARGEGMAAFVLKPLAEAVRDGDTVRAVIRGTAVNSNGRNPGITLPSREAQVRLIKSAYAQAGCDPAETGYCEAHGTGTAAGDPIEAGALGDSLGVHRQGGPNESNRLYVGSVKTNIGHLEGASGLAGLIKVVMSLEKGLIAPNLWFEKGNPAIDFAGWRLRVPTEVVPWPTSDSGLRRASVNGFGYGGTNGHVIVDDAYSYMRSVGIQGKHRTVHIPDIEPQNPSSSTEVSSSKSSHGSRSDSESITSTRVSEPIEDPSGARMRVFCLSGHEPASLQAGAGSYAEYLSTSTSGGNEDRLLDDLAYTLCERRSHLQFGTAVAASSVNELRECLASLPTVVQRLMHKPKLGFVFTGQGAQWWGMGRELMQFPVFRKTIEACGQVVQSLGASWSLFEELLRDEKSSRINEAELSQPLCSALQIALVELYASWNIVPTRVVGHSSGEIAAAYATGALSLESSMIVAYFRGLLSPRIKTFGYKGGMMAVGLSAQKAQDEIEALGTGYGQISVACVNSPRSVTLSGDTEALTQIQKRLASRQIFARKLQVETAYHSHHMLAIADEYRQCMAGLKVAPWSNRKSVIMYSSVWERDVTAEDDLSADYWVQNMVSRVGFSEALTRLCDSQENTKTTAVDILVELGPHAALAGPVKQILGSLPGLDHAQSLLQYFSVLMRGKDAAATAVTTAAILCMQGWPTDLHAVNFSHSSIGSVPTVLNDLPTYGWNRSRKYWAESRLSRDYRFRPFPRTDILGMPSHDWNPLEPRWRNFIRLSEQPWARSHVVQGAIVYPAAGYCCMALEAARQLVTIRKKQDSELAARSIFGYRITDLMISRALVLPETDEGVEVVLSMRPDLSSETRSEFRIYGHSSVADGWAEHCRGFVSISFNDEMKESALKTQHAQYESRLQEAKQFCTTNMAIDSLYNGLDSVGLYYGPEFQGIVRIAAGQGHATGIVQVTDTASGMPKAFEFSRLIHPATLDNLLQMTIAAHSHGDIGNLKTAWVPVSIKDLTVSGDISTPVGCKMAVTADARRDGLGKVDASVVALIESSQSTIHMQGVSLVALASSAANDGAFSYPNHCATAIWESDVTLLDAQQMGEVLRAATDEQATRYPSMKDLEFVAWYFFACCLEDLKPMEVEGMLPYHQQFVRYMQHQQDLVRAGQHEQQTEEWTALNSPIVSSRILGLVDAWEQDENNYEGQMVARMGRALPAVLRQQTDPLGLMMKDELLYRYYTTSLGVPSTYAQIRKYISLLSHKFPDLDYLEIGAGTGGCTAPILEALGNTPTGTRQYPRMKSYTYTDVSSGFFEHAAVKFADWSQWLEFARLDIEQDPETQTGFADRRFDVVIAANVLHATADISRTLSHTRKLLRPGGKLVLLDMTHPTLSVSLVFGNLSGWWASREPWRQQGPFVSEARWDQVLRDNEFSGLQFSSPDYPDNLQEQTRVMVATALESEQNKIAHCQTISQVLLITPIASSPSTDDLIAMMTRKLEDINITVTSCTLKESSRRQVHERAVISFVELDSPILADICHEDLSALQRLVRESLGLIWLTRGSIINGGRPELAMFQGLARSLRSEREGVPYVTLDFNLVKRLPTLLAADLIARLFTRVFVNPLSWGSELMDQEFSEKDGYLQIKRAVENPQLNEFIASRTKSVPLTPKLLDVSHQKEPLRLIAQTPGQLDSIAFQHDKQATEDDSLADNLVEVSVQSIGLNPADVLACLGDGTEEESRWPGTECAGVVIRAGSAVQHVVPGDRVVAWCHGALATIARFPGSCVTVIPEAMSFATAAALPLVWAPAYQSLVHGARLREGDSILIHGAGTATNIGYASVQLAKLHQAEVYATVDSTEQQSRLVEICGIPADHVFCMSLFDEASSLTEALRKKTSGRGVDILVDISSEEAAPATWLGQLIAPMGRLIEIGTRNDDSRGQLGNNVSWTRVNADAILRQNPEHAGEILHEVVALFHDHRVRDTTLVVAEPISNVLGCMRSLLEGKNKGKIVLENRSGDMVPVVPKSLDPTSFTADATYLLAGGLGGLGRSISKWMVSRGARNLLYVSRHGASAPETADLLKEFEASGVRSQVLLCDISDEERLATCLSDTLRTMPPLRGVIQGAMVLRDQIFTNMSSDAFTSCVRPKVHGSRALHNVTVALKQPLDFFILLSSCASFWGNAGQANYAAGCAYQVALAAHRRALGLPAVAIDVGKVANVGFVAQNAGTVSEQNLIKLGLLDIDEDELVAMLEVAMAQGEGCRHFDSDVPNGHLLTGVHSTNDPKKGDELPFWSRDPVFSHMDFVRPHIRNSQAKLKGQADEVAAQKMAQPLPERLGTAGSLDEAEGFVLVELVQKLARSLRMSPDDLDTRRPTAAYGIDSLIAVELRNWFTRMVKVDVPVFDILQASSLAALTTKVTAKSPLVYFKD